MRTWPLDGSYQFRKDLRDLCVFAKHDATSDPPFEPFSSGERPSAGLGLATVYGIVNQDHGFIHVFSGPGEGTTLYVDLPRQEPADKPAAGQSGSRQQAGGGGNTVLIVEDEPMVLKVCARTLEKLGFQVLRAGSPERALELVREHGHSIDLLLTDVIMPGMNGRELAEKAKSILPQIAVLFASGYGENVIVHHGIVDDGVNYIPKPYSQRELAAKVYAVLGERAQPRRE